MRNIIRNVGGYCTFNSPLIEAYHPSAGTPVYYAQANGCSFTGHYHIWGPALDANTNDQGWSQYTYTPWFQGSGWGTYCAEAWKKLGVNSYRSLGTRCKLI